MTLTQTCLTLLEKQENRELVNNLYFEAQIKSGIGLAFHFGTRWLNFDQLMPYEQREVIRLCLEVLPFFEQKRKYWEDIKPGDTVPEEEMARTYKAKYQRLLYLPVPELDAEFENEGVTINDLK